MSTIPTRLRQTARSIFHWWTADAFHVPLALGAAAFAAVLSAGVPYWDADFALFFTAIRGRTLAGLALSWLSPIYRGVENWGYQDRPAQFILYKISSAIAGYATWPQWVFKDACYAGLGVMIYAWALRLAPPSRHRRIAALAAAIFFLVAPGPVASHIWLGDFAPAAELAFLVLTFVLWREIERTPADWTHLPLARSAEARAWLLRWIGLSFVVYLSYQTKADLKAIPIILAAYLVLLRPRQWRLFGLPLALMVLLAVPWSYSTFTKLPPFIPGSSVPVIGYQWEPASFDVAREFVWSSQPYDFVTSLTGGTISLAGLFGPFLLVGAAVFFLWRLLESPRRLSWSFTATPADRARLFVVLWLGVILVCTSALPAINYFFRVRWGILTLVPCSILLGWGLGLFAESSSRLPRWVTVAGLALLTAQSGMNLARSLSHVRALTSVMTSVDRAYHFVDATYPNDELALWPDFLSYEYHLDASPALRHRDSVTGLDDLAQRHTPDKTLVLSWAPTLSEQFDALTHFDGCAGHTFVDFALPCPEPQHLYLTRYIGPNLDYAIAMAARDAGQIAAARTAFDVLLAKDPTNLGGRFQFGLLAAQQQDWTTADVQFAALEAFVPDSVPVLYNRGLTLLALKQTDAALGRLREVTEREPTNYEAQQTLYHAYLQSGRQADADRTMAAITRLGLVPTAPPVPAVDPVVEAERQTIQARTPENELNLSLAYCHAERYRECVDAAQAALAMRSDYAEAYNNIAAGYEGLEQWDNAIHAAQEALRLKPDFQLAKNNLQWSLAQKARIKK